MCICKYDNKYSQKYKYFFPSVKKNKKGLSAIKCYVLSKNQTLAIFHSIDFLQIYSFHFSHIERK